MRKGWREANPDQDLTGLVPPWTQKCDEVNVGSSMVFSSILACVSTDLCQESNGYLSLSVTFSPLQEKPLHYRSPSSGPPDASVELEMAARGRFGGYVTVSPGRHAGQLLLRSFAQNAPPGTELISLHLVASFSVQMPLKTADAGIA